MSSTRTRNYNVKSTVKKSETIGDFLYDIDSVLTQFMDHWEDYRDDDLGEIPVEVEGEYRGFSVEEDNLYFEITAESDERAVIELEYRDQKQATTSEVKGKLEKVWEDRIETVLERGKL